jgi:hypothetical protein
MIRTVGAAAQKRNQYITSCKWPRQMLKQYKNRLFQEIHNKGLDPRSFQTKETRIEGHSAFVLQLMNTPLKFIIRNSSDSYHRLDCSYSQFGPSFPMSAYYPPLEGSWTRVDQVLVRFSKWLEDCVKPYLEELLEPDLWEQVQLGGPIIGTSKPREEDRLGFSADEAAQIRLAMKEFRLLVVKTFDPSQEEKEVIDARLDYLAEAVDRLNRLDWRSVAITTVISISITLSLDTEKGRILFGLFQQVFSRVLYLLH